MISNAYAGALIEAAGSDEQRARWLPGIASGEARGAAELTRDPDPVVGAAAGASCSCSPTGRARSSSRPPRRPSSGST